MWITCLTLAVACLVLSALVPIVINGTKNRRKKKLNVFHFLFAGVFLAAFFTFFPIHNITYDSELTAYLHRGILSLFNAMQVFTLGTEYAIIIEGIGYCPKDLDILYQLWTAGIFVLAPVMSFGFVLSLLGKLTAGLKYFLSPFGKRYLFSEINDSSVALAADIKKNNKYALIAFADIGKSDDEHRRELEEKLSSIGAILFEKNFISVNFSLALNRKELNFFAICEDKDENQNLSLAIIEKYRNVKNTNLYVFSISVESELLLTAVDKGKMRVRRINQVRSLVNNLLYSDSGLSLFENANPPRDGVRDISAVVIGMGHHGCEMVKALSWFCQMDGYRIKINAFDKDPLADKKFEAAAPELMSPKYNGILIEGESQYTIKIHPGTDVESVDFANELKSIGDATYVFVALGDDDININTAVYLRMLFERMGIHPVIQAIVYNTSQKKALTGIKNYRGQEYAIDFIGDLESHFTEKVLISSSLEADALSRHLKWSDNEEEFWNFEYNYRSSTASAIHMKARIGLGIPGADKTEDELTPEEKNSIEILEHRRWNAYMRSEGYVFSGSTDKKTRNDLGKMHHNLVDFDALSEETKRLDSKVGTK